MVNISQLYEDQYWFGMDIPIEFDIDITTIFWDFNILCGKEQYKCCTRYIEHKYFPYKRNTNIFL